jgi:outer membrane protein TolC
MPKPIGPPVLRIAAAGLAWLLAAATPGIAQYPQSSPAAVGATLESTLAVARRLSPALAARALETEAAQARVIMAGSLPDPSLEIMSDDDRGATGARMNRMIYSFQQEIPLWGRLGLRQQAAAAEVAQNRALARNADVELAARVKVAFARYYAAWQAVHRTRDLHKAMQAIAAVARERYAQGRAQQAEVFRAELDTTRVATEVVRLDAELTTAQGQLNALLLRPVEAPLARPERLPAVPALGAPDMPRLVAKAHQANPALEADAAAVRAAESNRSLANRSWYPDLTLGASAVQRPGWGPPGYRAWIGVKIPLQWGLHEGEIRQAAAQAQAARAQRDSREQQIDSDLAEAIAGLQGSRRTADLIRRQLLPQAEAMVRSGAAAYAVDRIDLGSVLRSEHDLSDIRLQLLAAEFDSQRQLAAIERLVGGDL